MTDALDSHVEAVSPLLRSRDADMVAQGIELVQASGPGLRDAVLQRVGLTHRVAVALALRCEGTCPPWVRLELPFHRRDLSLLHAHPEVTSLTVSLWADADAEGIVLPPLPPTLQRLSIRGRYTGTWTLSLAEQVLPALTSLSLSNARLLALPTMPALRDVEMRACPGDGLGPLLSPLLRRLTVSASSEPLGRLDLSALPGLEQLQLESTGLTAVPDGIGALGRLEQLNLSNNRISRLPPALGQLAALRELKLSNNPLSALPPELGRLQALRQLQLAACPLTALPPEVGMLGLLQRLSLRHTRLSELPPGLSKLPQLSILDLSGTQIAALPKEGLPALRSLTIRNAALDLGRGGPLPALRQLYIGRSGEAGARAWIAAAPERARIEIRR